MKRVALCLLLTFTAAAGSPPLTSRARREKIDHVKREKNEKTTTLKKEKGGKSGEGATGVKPSTSHGESGGQVIWEVAGTAASGTMSAEITTGATYNSVPDLEHEADRGREQENDEHVIPVRQGEVWDSIPAPRIPPSQPIVSWSKGSANAGTAAATDFKVQTATGLSASAAPSRLVTGEPSVASLSNNTAFYTGNRYAARSFDGGQTFSYVSPYNTFPNVNGGFCCDQVAHYAPAQSMLLWALQYYADSSSNTLRIARTIGSTGLANNNWASYSFTPQTFGFPSGMMLDFPNLTVGATYLYVSSNVFNISTRLFAGAVLLRIPLSELAAGGTINYQYYSQNRSNNDVGGLRCTEGAKSTMYCAGHSSTSQVCIFEWADGSNSIPATTVSVQPYSYITDRTPAVALSPDGTNWAGHIDSRILGSWLSNGVIGLMWTARQDATFTYPYVVVAQFDATTKSLISQTPIYSNATAWLYPTASVNAAGSVAGLLSFGGGQYYPGANIWISDDVQSGFSPLALYGGASGNAGPVDNTWGDYQSVRPHADKPNTWVASTQVLSGGGTDSNVVPVFLWFGRERDLGTPTCSYSIAPTSAVITSGGGSGSVTITASAGCGWTAASNVSWLTITAGALGNGLGTVSYSVAANTGTTQRTGTLIIAGQTFTVTQTGAPCSYSISPTSNQVGAAATIGGVSVTAGTGCAWTAASNASWITITSGASGTGNGTVGYSVSANTATTSRSSTLTIAGKSFTVTQAAATAAPTVQFSAATYLYSEGASSAAVTVTRTGSTSSASTVSFRTVDATDAVPCDPTLRQPDGTPYPSGKAFARCDYATVVGTITFAAGEVSKQVLVPVINDAHVEGGETFQVALSNPSTGTSLGTPSTATVTISDNDVAGQVNPILTTVFFVRQQYLDFLNREPEAGEPWSATLNNCAAGNLTCDRISVSAAFFGSPEFQIKGAYVFRFYRLAFGRLPAYDEIVPDMSFVAGSTSAEVFQRKADLAVLFNQRPEFAAAYGGLTNDGFVNTLMNRYALSQITTPNPATPDGTAKVTLTRADLVGRLNAATLTRAQVFRAISDSDQVSAAEANRAFVAMQYYGYLRRMPEEPGYSNWLVTINSGDIRTMVNGFLNSAEYRRRFGQP